MAPTTRKFSYFSKYFTSVDREQKLRVPKAWSSKFGKRLPCSAYLRNTYGNIWVVTVARDKKTERVSFEEGWSKFIEFNNVEYKDKIVFRYDSMSTFDFKLFGKNNVEKEYLRLPNCVKEEEVQLEDVQAEAVSEDVQAEAVSEDVQAEAVSKDVQAEAVSDEGHAEAVSHEGHAEAVSDEGHIPDPENQASPIGDLSDEDFDVDDEFTDKEVNPEKKTGKKRAPRISEADEETIFRKAGISRPENPFFVTKRRPNRNEMYIPTDVVKDFQLIFPEEIVLRDEKGMEWKADVKKWKDGRIWLSKAWRAYCRHNHVGKEDWCIVEIVKPEEPSADIFIKARLVPSSALKAARRS